MVLQQKKKKSLAGRSLLGAMFACKCPRCREGNFFLSGPYKLKSFTKMHAFCPFCGVKIEPEPGYFWGAMYFSYALVVAICVPLMMFFFYFGLDQYFFSMAFCMMLVIASLVPIIFRFSRMLLIYLTAPYRKFDPSSK